MVVALEDIRKLAVEVETTRIAYVTVASANTAGLGMEDLALLSSQYHEAEAAHMRAQTRLARAKWDYANGE